MSIYALRLPLQDEWTSSGAEEKILSFTDEFKGKVRMDGERSIALKNHMQQKGWITMGKSKIALKALFLFIFAFLFLSAEEVAARPQWLKVDCTPYIVVTGKNPQASDYYSLKIVVEHINKSDNEIITAIFDKKLIFSALFNAGYSTSECTAVLRSTKVSKVEIYPGQSVKLAYQIRLDTFIKNVNWVPVNSYIARKGLKTMNKVIKTSKGTQSPNMHFIFDERHYRYNCKVRTE